MKIWQGQKQDGDFRSYFESLLSIFLLLFYIMGSIGSKYPTSPLGVSRKLSHRLHELTELDTTEEGKAAFPSDELRWLKLAGISFLACSGTFLLIQIATRPLH